MSRKEWAIIGILLVSVLVVFCMLGVFALTMLQGSPTSNEASLAITPDAPTAGKPTAMSYPTWPPTYTPVPIAAPTWVIQRAQPTPTWVLPRATRKPATVAPTRTRVPGPIQDAWDKTARAQAQRFEMGMTLAGDIWNLPGATGSKIEFSFMSFSGELQGHDSHFIMKGYAVDMMIPSSKGLEIITLGDKVYVHGPVPLLNAPEAKWYVEKMNVIDRSRPLSRPIDWMGYGYSNPNWSGLKQAGQETVDGKKCDVYRGDKTAALLWYQSANPEDIPDQDAFADFDAADVAVWICNDGYVHQFITSLTTHSKYDVKQKGTMQLKMHFYDINGAIKITAPPSPVPMNLPQSSDDTL